jgi:hypothetical protein
MYSGIKDYNLLQEGNKSLLAEHSELRYCCEDLESELAKVHSSVVEDVAALESRIRSAKAHSVEIATAGEKRLSDFEGELVKAVAGPCAFYERNIQSIEGLCSLMPESEPSAMDYIRWLSTEVNSLSKVFAGVNENFISAVVEVLS